ncbi:hypothetical protein MUK70_20725 [Dyadobacter chenwenxiniae]|uniref:Uncharacterized protein n=1 Tax=Dyadobacter chenwenxiniae TaxID=2906456 RepID=A0A9X1PJ37_9BACT|nr:hypothetical protein [Dyadobacter chenwenxiniae]MCF0061666.1 hypothetical protein [Dyadobacter chenwenxiniae]UON81487.1 hypothetical protein MUK70_20725 [Dyadobacter chenwenxiniae]
MEAETPNESTRPQIIIDNSLKELLGKNHFPELLKKVNEILKKSGLPDLRKLNESSTSIMEAEAKNSTIVDGYVDLLENLSLDEKLDLISKLSESVKSDQQRKKSLFKEAFGAFESSKSAEEIIDDIRSSRVSTRQTESF